MVRSERAENIDTADSIGVSINPILVAGADIIVAHIVLVTGASTGLIGVVLGASIVVRILVAGTGLTALMLGTSIGIGVLVAGAGLTTDKFAWE